MRAASSGTSDAMAASSRTADGSMYLAMEVEMDRESRCDEVKSVTTELAYSITADGIPIASILTVVDAEPDDPDDDDDDEQPTVSVTLSKEYVVGVPSSSAARLEVEGRAGLREEAYTAADPKTAETAARATTRRAHEGDDSAKSSRCGGVWASDRRRGVVAGSELW